MWPFREHDKGPIPPAPGRANLINGNYRALLYSIGPREEEWCGDPVSPDRLVNEALRYYEVTRRVEEAMAVIDHEEEERERARERAMNLAEFGCLLRDAGVDVSPAENPTQIAGLWFEQPTNYYSSELRCGTSLCTICGHVVGETVTALSDIGAILAGKASPYPHYHATKEEEERHLVVR